MQFNKCSRCGCFFVSTGDVCPNCQPKDNMEMNKLRNFLEDSNMDCSLENISYNDIISSMNKLLQIDNIETDIGIGGIKR